MSDDPGDLALREAIAYLQTAHADACSDAALGRTLQQHARAEVLLRIADKIEQATDALGVLSAAERMRSRRAYTVPSDPQETAESA